MDLMLEVRGEIFKYIFYNEPMTVSVGKGRGYRIVDIYGW